MDISELLNGQLGQQLINGISGKTGTSGKETSSVIAAAAPALLGMLKKNASSEEGAASLLNALNKHDGSVLGNLSGFLNSQEAATDGNAILGHVLGVKRSPLESAISKQTGVSGDKVGSIIAMLAPVLMGALGKQKSASGNAGLGDILGNMLGQQSGASNSIVTALLDQDGDGKLTISDALAALSGQKKKSGGLGGLLGGLFGGK